MLKEEPCVNNIIIQDADIHFRFRLFFGHQVQACQLSAADRGAGVVNLGTLLPAIWYLAAGRGIGLV